MKAPDLILGPEWAILELLSLGLAIPEEQEMFEELIKSGCIHWGELLEQALRHKMLPVLAFHATADKFREAIPRFVRHHLQTALDLNRYKTAIFRGAAATIVKAFDEQGIRFVGTKGIVFEGTLYGGNGSRNFSFDMDFMIAPDDRDVVISTMHRLGYQMGEFGWKAGLVKAYSRQKMLIYQLNPDHVPVFARLIDDSIVKCVSVDFANSFTWTRSSFEVPIETALAKVLHQPIPGHSDIQMPVFPPNFQFIFTVLHLFREAWFESWLNIEQDVNLSKFADVVRLWHAHRKELQSANFVQKMEEFGIVEPVLWVLEHLDRTLHTGIVPALGIQARVSESWLVSAHTTGGGMRQWKGTMRQRLYCKDRKALFVNSL